MKFPSLYDFNGWSKLVPALRFPAEWGVKILPTGKRMISRFRIMGREPDSFVSVIAEIYIDKYLHWEVAKVVGHDVNTTPEHFDINEIDKLIAYISKCLDEING